MFETVFLTTEHTFVQKLDIIRKTLHNKQIVDNRVVKFGRALLKHV
jgi:hypothetical protein